MEVWWKYYEIHGGKWHFFLERMTFDLHIEDGDDTDDNVNLSYSLLRCTMC